MKNPIYKHHYLVECEDCHRVIGFYAEYHRDHQPALEKPPELICPACWVKAVTFDEKFWDGLIAQKEAKVVEPKKAEKVQ